MNIFENYLLKINDVIINNKDILNLDNLANLNSINLEVPPDKFNYDLSSNLSLVLAKSNKIDSKNLAIKIKNLLIKKIDHFEKIDIAGPGFLNIKLSKDGLILNINQILNDRETYGSKKSNETFNVEFVSANPTGPMHVGHCRGAIFGDVLSNLLKFNGNKVIKEYYINDYGNQIKNFVESIYLRIREIKFKEKFVIKENLYPGNYVKEIALNIIENYKSINVENFNDCYEDLRKLSLEASMNLIKKDLKKLGISHDIFFSETEIVKKNLVKKVVNLLKEKNMQRKDTLTPEG